GFNPSAFIGGPYSKRNRITGSNGAKRNGIRNYFDFLRLIAACDQCDPGQWNVKHNIICDSVARVLNGDVPEALIRIGAESKFLWPICFQKGFEVVCDRVGL